jgi:phage recombination protein Bet
MDNQLTTISKDKIVEYLDSVGLGQSLTSAEKVQFFNVCLAYNLNPIKKEIYAVKYGQNPISIIVGFETYIKRAERSGNLDGYDVRAEGNVKDNSLKAIITIYRKDWSRPFIHEVHYSEYIQRTKDGQITKFWLEKPITMLKKVAMSQGFRLCFSDENGGLPYSEEEINIKEVENIQEVTKKPSMNDKQFNALVNRIKNGESVLEKAKSMFSFTKEQENILAAISTVSDYDFIAEKIKASEDEKDLLTIRQDVADLADEGLINMFNDKCLVLEMENLVL